MARYVIDAPTLLHLADAGLHVTPGHQLVAPNSVRSEALELLPPDVRAGKRTEAAALEAHERMTEIKIRLLSDQVFPHRLAGRTPARLGHAQGRRVPRAGPASG